MPHLDVLQWISFHLDGYTPYSAPAPGMVMHACWMVHRLSQVRVSGICSCLQQISTRPCSNPSYHGHESTYMGELQLDSHTQALLLSPFSHQASRCTR
jgi:hypothetical protein